MTKTNTINWLLQSDDELGSDFRIFWNWTYKLKSIAQHSNSEQSEMAQEPLTLRVVCVPWLVIGDSTPQASIWIPVGHCSPMTRPMSSYPHIWKAEQLGLCQGKLLFSHIGQVMTGCTCGPWSFSGLRYSVVVLVLKLSRIIVVVTLEILRNGTNHTWTHWVTSWVGI